MNRLKMSWLSILLDIEEVAEGCSSAEGERVLLICLLDPQKWKNTIVDWLLYEV